MCCTLGEEDNKALSLASRGSQLGWGDGQGSPQSLTSGIGLAEDSTESWREGSRDPWVSREGGSLEAGPPRTPGGLPVISHVSNSQGFTGCVGVGVQDGSGRQGSSGACPGHLRGRAQSLEQWERGSSHLHPWKLSRVLTRLMLQIKAADIQAEAQLRGLSAEEFPLEQSCRDHGRASVCSLAPWESSQ